MAPDCAWLEPSACYTAVPTVRPVDRVIAFLRNGGKPAGPTMQSSAVWLQNGVAYAFQQTVNPGTRHSGHALGPQNRPAPR
ncbi:MAG: hypothetical protein JSU00_26000 [Acidobacteria bacterium]|nr:hypothetical protein [Acidobacteriota bacterium]